MRATDHPARWSVGVRTLAVVVLAAMAGVSCRSGPHLPGAPFAGASLLLPLSDAEEWHDALLRADLARADSVARLGYADGLAGSFDQDVVFLRGGLPIIRGKAAAHAIVATEEVGRGATVRWQPVRAETSRDGRSGFSYGFTIFGVSQGTSAPAVRVDRYIAFWKRGPSGWRIAAYAETYGAPPAPLALPPAAEGAQVRDTPMVGVRGALQGMHDADAAFSQFAARYGTGEAFGHFAAADAQIFSAPGEFISGPAAITASFGSSSGRSSLVWHPVLGDISAAGDLGFTVGNAVFTGERADGERLVNYSKYLTVWRKQGDGTWRYVVDGGSARPNQ